jgi:hypothetical protein
VTTKPCEGPLTPRQQHLPGDSRDELRIALERLHIDHRNKLVDDPGVLSRLRDWRPDMDDTDLWALWEDISGACGRLAGIREALPGGSLLQYGHDLVIEYGINQLAGECCR